MPHIELVVQFLVPASLSVWMQCAGRAGRSPDIQARAILLIQPTVFQERHSKVETDPNKPGKVTYVKDVDDGLHAWLETTACRRDVADQYFNSTCQRKGWFGHTVVCLQNIDAKFSQHLRALVAITVKLVLLLHPL